MLSLIIGITFSAFEFSWISSALVIENVINVTEKWHWYFITMFIPLYLIIYPMIYKAHSRVSSTRWCFNNTRQLCFYLCLNPYILNTYNMEQNLSLASQTICDHMFSDLKLDHNFHVFWLRTWLVFFSYRMWKFSTYFEEGGVLEYTVSWFPIILNQLHPEYYLPPNNRPNSKYYLNKYSKNSIE